MSVRDMEAGPMMVGARTANERFRVRWRKQLGWSIGLAVALHVAAFAGAARLVLSFPIPTLDTLIETDGLVVLPYDDGVGAGQLPSSVVAPPGGALVASDENADVAATLGAGGSSMSDDALRAALGERLRRRGGSRVARITEPVVEPEPQEVAAEEGAPAEGDEDEESDPEIGADATTTADLAELPDPDTLSLDRLSGLEPQLALVSASAWVLIRNQQEVEAYLRRGYSDGELDASEIGTVSVTLWIDRKGSVEWAEISRSSGHPKLDEYALAVFNEVADFRAAREQGVSVSRSVTFSLNFPW